MGVYVYYHIFCNEHTLPIVREQTTRILFSGLAGAIDEVRCCIIGEETFRKPVIQHIQRLGPKFRVVYARDKDTLYERTTLFMMRHLTQPQDKCLYIHTKGITKPDAENIWYWRTWMEYALMVRWKECLEALEDHDIVGVNYVNATFIHGRYIPFPPHFSGNMWWCRGDYYLRLPPRIGPDYVAPELYIFRGDPPPRWKELDAGTVPQNAYLGAVLVAPRDYIRSD